MASHFVALNRGIEGTSQDDFITGVAATANVIELRLDDASNFRQVDFVKAIKALQRFAEDRTLWATAGFIING